MTKELAKKEEQLPAVLGEHDPFAPETNLDNVDFVSLPKVEIEHSAGMFSLSGQEDPVKTFEGFIVYNHKSRVWWKKPIEDGGGKKGALPDCFTTNGITPTNASSDKQAASCDDCQHSKFINDVPGTCKQQRQLYVAIEGQTLVNKLSLPQTSIKAFNEYSTALTNNKKALISTKTKFKLRKEENAQGKKYSIAEFEDVDFFERDSGDPRVEFVTDVYNKVIQYLAELEERSASFDKTPVDTRVEDAPF